MRASRVKAELNFDLKRAVKNPLLKWALSLVIDKVLEVFLKWLTDKDLIKET